MKTIRAWALAKDGKLMTVLDRFFLWNDARTAMRNCAISETVIPVEIRERPVRKRAPKIVPRPATAPDWRKLVPPKIRR